MTKILTNLLVRIYGRQPDQKIYRVEASLEDGSTFNGQLQFEPETLLAGQTQEAYGRNLFEALFTGDILEAYHQVAGLAKAQDDRFLRLRLEIDPEAAELHALRWERLQIPDQQHWLPLAATDYTPFSRYLRLKLAQARALTAYPLKVLVALANPTNLEEQYRLAPIDAETELKALHQVLVNFPNLRGELDVTVLPGSRPLPPGFRDLMIESGYRVLQEPTSLESLLRQLEGCHLFHFIGHGLFRRSEGALDPGRAALLLETNDSSGRVRVVWDDILIDRIKALTTPPHLVFLGACESARRSEALNRENAYIGLAPKLVQAGIPAVVAMQDLISMEGARDLAVNFYQKLGQHGLVDLALNQARWALLNAYPQDWDIPVLFMRLDTGQLLAPNPVRTTLEAIRDHYDTFFLPTRGRYLDLPIEVVYLTRRQLTLSSSRRSLSTTARIDLLEAVLDRFERIEHEKDPDAHPNIVILAGDYGTNRSTQLQRIAWETAKASLKAEGRRLIIPVYLDIQDYSKLRTTLGNPIAQLILEQVRQFWPDLNANSIDDLLESGVTLRLLIDGSEHLPERERYTAWDYTRAFIRLHPRQQYLIATDFKAILSSRFDKSQLHLHTLVIQPLDARKIRRFLRRRAKTTDPTDPNLRLLASLDQGQLFDLVSMPWFLVKTVEWVEKGDVPASRTHVLQRIVDEAILKVPPNYGMRAHTEPAIYHLAWEMQSAGAASWQIDRFFEMMVAIRGNRDYNLERFYEALLAAGLLAPVGDHAIRFTYAPIQSYCCAQAIARLPDDQRHQLLDDITATLGRLSRLRRWEDTLVFLSGLLAQAPEALEELLWLIVYGVNLFVGEQTFLAARCLLESKQYLVSKQLKPTLVDLPNQVINALVWRLNQRNEPSEDHRVRAIQLLGQLTYLEAYGYPTVIPYLIQVACKKARRDSFNRPDYYYSSLRLTAASALQYLTGQQVELVTKNPGALHPELLKLLQAWQQEDVPALMAQLDGEDESLQAIAALALGDLQAQFENDPDPEMTKLGQEITACLIDQFFDLKSSPSLLWAVTHALSLLNSTLVNRHVILPFIKKEKQNHLVFTSRGHRIQWYKCVVYLIGQIRSQEPEVHRFLISRCLKQFVDVRLWAGIVDALGWLGDERYKKTLERIAIGDFSQLAPEYEFSEDDQVERYLQHRAIEALARIGDLHTLTTLRERSSDWDAELRQAFYRTSEEIHWRTSQKIPVEL